MSSIDSSRDGVDADRTQEADSGVILSAGSDQKPTLSVILPTLNEEEGIAECIENIKHAASELDTTAEIIVSDSSDDRTPEIAEELGAIVVEPDQEGYGYAYQYAFQFTRGEYVAIGDADTTYDFQELPDLFARMMETDADMVLGSRLEGEIKPGAMPALHQYIGNPSLTKFLNVFYGAGVTDAHSGFRVMPRDTFERLDLRSTGMEFASEMIMDAAAKGLTIEEVPITYHERRGDATLDSFRDGWRHVKFMLTNAPDYLFSLPAVFLSACGIFLMLISLPGVQFVSSDFAPHLMILGSLLLIGGFQIGSFGVFSSIASDPIRTPQDRFTRWIRDSFRLEHGTTVGVCLCLAGGLFGLFLIGGGVSRDVVVRPGLRSAIIAFTAIVLGLQMVFSSFFFSTIANRD